MIKTLQKIGVFTLGLAIVFPLLAPVSASAEITKNMCSSLVRDLTLGSTGADVIALQAFLEEKGYLTIPAGVSKGYFGNLTRAAVSRYQATNGIYPTYGYFGPLTRGKLVSACATGVSTPGKSGELKGGEASLESFDLSSGDDSNVKEGSSAEIAEIEFDVEDGDIRIDRIDLRLVADNDNEEKDPWDTFESLRLLVDGKKIAEIDLNDEDEYLDEDDGTIRILNLNHIVREGDSVTIVVEVTTQNSVDGADNNLATWTLTVEDDGIRATDAEGIQQYIGSDSETVVFDVDEEGADDELDVRSSSEDPDSTTLKVEDDARSDEYEIFAFDLEAGDSDIEIDTVQVVLESDVAISNLVSDLILEIDGEEFDDWSFVGTGTSTRTIEFDINGDYTLDANDEVTIFLIAEFKAANGTNYSSGATIQASIENNAIEGEGADDVISDGAATGEEHTLATEGVVMSQSGFTDKGSEKNNDTNTSRDYTFTFEVEALEEDFYIATSLVDVFYDGAGTANIAYTVDSTADEDTNGVFTVNEGDTETFTVVVTVSNVSVSGQYRVGLDSVDYTTNSDGVTNTSTKDVVNSDFRTGYATINN